MIPSRHGFAHALRRAQILTPAIGRPIFASRRPNSTDSKVSSSQSHSTNDSRDEHSSLSTKIRTLMRLYPHALAAVVAPSDPLLPNRSLPKDRLVQNPNRQSALLVSSLNTVTLHPTPYISFNIKTLGSRTYDNIRKYEKFTVSGLEDPMTAQAFVTKFEDRGRNRGREEWKASMGEEGKVTSGRGGSWWMICRYQEKMSAQVGDHVILVGEVLDAGSEMREEEMKETQNPGMVYLDGKYRWVGEVAESESLVSRFRLSKVTQPTIRRPKSK